MVTFHKNGNNPRNLYNAGFGDYSLLCMRNHAHSIMEKNDMTRRTALKIMGSVALATVMATTGASALTSCIGRRKKRVVLNFTVKLFHAVGGGE